MRRRGCTQSIRRRALAVRTIPTPPMLFAWRLTVTRLRRAVTPSTWLEWCAGRWWLLICPTPQEQGRWVPIVWPQFARWSTTKTTREELSKRGIGRLPLERTLRCRCRQKFSRESASASSWMTSNLLRARVFFKASVPVSTILGLPKKPQIYACCRMMRIMLRVRSDTCNRLLQVSERVWYDWVMRAQGLRRHLLSSYGLVKKDS